MQRPLSLLCLLAVCGWAAGQEKLPAGAARRLGSPDFRRVQFEQPVLSPDGSLLAYRCDETTVRAVEPRTWKTVRELAVPKERASGGGWRFLGNTADRFLFLTVNDAEVFDAKTGRSLFKLPGQGTRGGEFSVTPDGSVGLLCAKDPRRPVVVTDLNTGKELASIAPGFKSDVAGAISGDGKTAALVSLTVTRDGKDIKRGTAVQIWDAKAQKKLKEFAVEGFQRYPTLSPDGGLLAMNAGTNDGRFLVYDTKTGEPVLDEAPKGFPPESNRPFTFSPDGKRLAVAAGAGDVRVWDLGTKKEIARTKSPRPRVFGVGFDAAGNAVVCGGVLQAVVTWKLGDEPPAVPAGHSASPNALRFTADGKHLLSASADGRVLKWDASTGNVAETIYEGKPGPGGVRDIQDVTRAVFSPDGKYLAWVNSQRRIVVLDVVGKKLLPESPVKAQFPPTWGRVAFSKDSAKLFAVGLGFEDKKQAVFASAWGIPDGKALLDERVPPPKAEDPFAAGEAVIRKKFADDWRGHPAAGGFEAVVSDEETSPFFPGAVAERYKLAVKSVKSGDVVLTLEPWMAYPGAVALSPDGRRLAVGWNDTTILLFDVAGKK